MIDEFLEAGILQFGSFEGVPFKLNLELLPSYPDIMRLLVSESLPKVNIADYDHLVCTVDSVPFGIALSIQSNIPLVYSRGTNQSGVRDLVGAYDTGHPALLVTNVWSGDGYTLALIEKAQNVGLQIKDALAIVDLRDEPVEGLNLQTLLKLNQTIQHLAKDGRMPQGQAKAVLEWLER